jgi:hypothetical protein
LDAIPAATSGSYISTGPAFGMTVSIGAGAVTFSESGFLNIGILNSFVDQCTVLASSPALMLDLFFQGIRDSDPLHGVAKQRALVGVGWLPGWPASLALAQSSAEFFLQALDQRLT